MERFVLSTEIVAMTEKYGIVKSKEKSLDNQGRPFGSIQTWYDVCLECGDGDIVASFGNLRAATKWVREN